MRIGVIDCDKKNAKHIFPNLALMKLSAWHKARGDTVEWYEQWTGKYDKVYVSKDTTLPYDVEHIYPDYSLYGIDDTAYGFITRGCPRGCSFCHVQSMQGCKAHKVADLSEFWNGQKNIVLLDPNISACADWRDVFQQLIDSKACIDFSQGLDIRLMTDEKIEMLKQIKTKSVHFAWDRYEDKDIILPTLKRFKEITNWGRRKIIVYCLVGDRSRNITPEDLERIYIA